MGRLNDFLDSLPDDGEEQKPDIEYTNYEPGIGAVGMKIASSLHRSFQQCETISRVTLGNPSNNELPINMGKVKDKDLFLLGIGDGEEPFKMNKKEFLYMLKALNKIGGKIFEDEGEDLTAELALAKPLIELGSSEAPKELEDKTIEELQDLLEKAEKLKKSIQEEEPDTPEYEEAVKSSKDMQEIFNSLSDEEKKILEKDIAKQRQDAIYDRAKALEKDLTGDLETEAKIDYNYAYFKKIYKDKGTNFMREELAKIPKEERKDIIDKIVEEVRKETEDE
tara:strand:- start:336 stop:1175 length:840 start_codon:yes stop_codon:yes gene_type:complete